MGARTLCLFLLVFLGLHPIAAGAVIRVPRDHATIQQALQAAAAGDTVLVAPGIYKELITWPARDGIRLVGELGPAQTTIDAGGAGRVVTMGSGLTRATLLQGFTITGGLLKTDRNYGCGINVASSPTIRGNVIKDNLGDGPNWNYGGGIYVAGGSALIEGNTISGNLLQNGSWNYGAGIYISSGAQPEVLCNDIRQNGNVGGSRGYGAGIFVGGSPAPVLASNLIFENYNKSGSWNYGGGIRVYSSASATIVNNTVVYNKCIGGSWSYGGGIEDSGNGTRIQNNIVAFNQAATGGGIKYGGTTTPPILGCNDLWNNTTGDYNGIAADPTDISSDPKFVIAGIFHLRLDSPCVDAGGNAHVLGLACQALDGSPRLQDGNLDGLAGDGARVDIGAYEYTHARLAASGPPKLGTPVTLQASGPAGSFGMILVSPLRGVAFVDPFGVLLVGAPLLFLGNGALPLVRPLPLPPLTFLEGIELHCQAVVALWGPQTLANTSNRLDFILF